MNTVMALSPMSCASLRTELLTARDAREALLAAVLAHSTEPGYQADPAAAAGALVVASCAIPGPEKSPAGSRTLFDWGQRQLQQQLVPQRIVGGREDILGPYCIAVTVIAPYTVKRICLAIEQAVPAARLLDLDVYTAYGQRISRTDIGAPPRSCLLCQQPASDCIRLYRHSMGALLDHVTVLLDTFNPASDAAISPLASD